MSINIDQECITLVYSNYVTGDKSVFAKYYILGWTFFRQLVSNNRRDIFEMSSIIIGNIVQYNSTSALNNLTDSSSQQNKWVALLVYGWR